MHFTLLGRKAQKENRIASHYTFNEPQQCVTFMNYQYIVRNHN